MNVLIFGATGMVGQGVMRECLQNADVARVLTIGRRTTGQCHPKLREMAVPDVGDLTTIESELDAFDACFFSLGVSSVGLSEERYTRITYDVTLAAGRILARVNPAMTFIYVSGMGTDSTERGRAMWARVKGRTENAVLALPFKGYAFRPGVIIPEHGIRSGTRWYRVLYAVMTPVLPLVKACFHPR